jgi:hypothetical protein
MRIRDEKSRIRDKHPGSATLRITDMDEKKIKICSTDIISVRVDMKDMKKLRDFHWLAWSDCVGNIDMFDNTTNPIYPLQPCLRNFAICNNVYGTGNVKDSQYVCRAQNCWTFSCSVLYTEN